MVQLFHYDMLRFFVAPACPTRSFCNVWRDLGPGGGFRSRQEMFRLGFETALKQARSVSGILKLGPRRTPSPSLVRECKLQATPVNSQPLVALVLLIQPPASPSWKRRDARLLRRRSLRPGEIQAHGGEERERIRSIFLP